MASPYDEEPELVAYRNKVSELRAMTITAINMANAAVAQGGDFATVIAYSFDVAEPIYLECVSLPVTGIPSELIQYRDAWVDQANTTWGFA